MSANDGGPAYPVHANHALIDGRVVAVHEQGMSLRDWFAGKALQGILANPDCPERVADAVDSSWRIADAMLRAREGGVK